MSQVPLMVKQIQKKLYRYWDKIFRLLIRRYPEGQTDERITRIINNAHKTIKENPGSSSRTLFNRVVKVIKKIERVYDQALGLFIDDLQYTREEALLEKFIKALPVQDFIRTGRTVTITRT
jgi:hypothetical protein